MGWLVGSVYKTQPVAKTAAILTNPLMFYGFFVVSFSGTFITTTFPVLFEYDYLPDSQVLFVLYFTLKRILFVAPLVYMIFLFRSGPSKLKSFFSLRICQPLSKLSVSLITVQFLYFFYFLATRREPIRFTLETLGREFAVCVVYCFIAGNLFYFFFERPVSILFRELLEFAMRRNRPEENCKANQQTGQAIHSNDLNGRILSYQKSTDSKLENGKSNAERIDINHNHRDKKTILI